MTSQSAKLYYNRLITEGENISFNEHRQLPPFYDPIKYKRGQSFFREYFTSICLNYIVGLAMGLSDPKLNFILRHTNNSSKPKTAYKRYYLVVKHLLIWMEEDFESSTVWKSLKVVQSKHAKANKSTKMINQRDLGLATMGFLCPILVNLEIFGMASAKTEDLEAFLHMWRNLSYVMGTDDSFNPCTTESVDVVSSISREIALHCAGYISKNMWEYHSMLDAFCRGFSIFLPLSNGLYLK
ncbi:PREDICTED: uncharacterized protein LOC108565732 [Nicrophorus vespilloides]|uniref:Uncharacterized protein LOC108565732 n=1 Tax=Nicrophorus vespilloides TaxID=110193 RepID=A0ABM1N1W4_NICVS|nr:PREDICTED: uncharacterized protein LOC108565732 [Nicrophorus vespilloides]